MTPKPRKAPPKKKPKQAAPIENRPKGQPRAFETEQIFLDKFKEYITHCIENKRFPNIAGFCVFADIVKDTYYAQQQYYSDSYNKTRQMLENEVWQYNDYRSQLYVKNVFGYTDKQVVESTNVNLNHEMSESEAEEILKRYKISE